MKQTLKSQVSKWNLYLYSVAFLNTRAIFEVLDLMKMDMANFTIQQIRPYCQQQSVEYERKKFLDFLKSQQGQGLMA